MRALMTVSFFASRKLGVLGLLLATVLIAGSARAQEAGDQEKTVRILTIGNSFANNAVTFLQEMATAAGKRIVIGRANRGACSLQMHAEGLVAYLADPLDPKGKIYRLAAGAALPGWSADVPGQEAFSLPEALQAQKWNFVTIQQVSTSSFSEDTYEPYAGELISCIRKYAPQAEILVHRTWAYREDSSRFTDGTFTQQMMFDGLKKAYDDLAAHYGLRIIPTGDAFQAA